MQHTRVCVSVFFHLRKKSHWIKTLWPLNNNQPPPQLPRVVQKQHCKHWQKEIKYTKKREHNETALPVIQHQLFRNLPENSDWLWDDCNTNKSPDDNTHQRQIRRLQTLGCVTCSCNHKHTTTHTHTWSNRFSRKILLERKTNKTRFKDAKKTIYCKEASPE